MCFGAFTEEADLNPNRRPLYFGDARLEYVKKRSSTITATTSDGRPRRSSSVYVASLPRQRTRTRTMTTTTTTTAASLPRSSSHKSKSYSYSSHSSGRTLESPVSPRSGGWEKRGV